MNQASNKEIEADFDQFEYGALAVEAHTTRAGFLFYDVSELTPAAGASCTCTSCATPTATSFSSLRYLRQILQSKSSQMK